MTSSARVSAAVPTAGPEQLAEDVLRRMQGARFEAATEVVVLEGERFCGMAPIESLLAAKPGTKMRELADTESPSLRPESGAALVAHILSTTGQRAIAVADENERFIGVVGPSEIVSLLHDEHAEDLARLGGYTAGADRARSAAEEPVGRRLAHRLPWLLVGLVGAMASALLVGAFEEQLAKNVLIAFFVPAIVYMADAVGTQTETVLIRGLAAGVTTGSVVRRELLTGLITGVIIGAAFLAFAILAWGDADVAIAVALALLASCSIATGVAMLLPTLFQRFGADPAFGSGPLATVAQDLLSIAVYLGTVTLMLA